MATKQQAISELLAALGFEAMARDVLNENDAERLSRYARIVIKNSPQAVRYTLVNSFRQLRVIA